MARQVVTFDLFSALIDSRRGGSAFFQRLAGQRGWRTDAESVYDRWDAANKEAHRRCSDWVPFRLLARDALARTYQALALEGEPTADAQALLDGVGDWPLWPDVRQGLADLGGTYRLGLLSNVDDEIFARTAAAALVDDDVVLTSQRLRAYKPDARIYERARQRVPGMVHVATSARDVRGATEAGIRFVRLRRPGHEIDPETPPPTHQAGGMHELPRVLDLILRPGAAHEADGGVT